MVFPHQQDVNAESKHNFMHDVPSSVWHILWVFSALHPLLMWEQHSCSLAVAGTFSGVMSGLVQTPGFASTFGYPFCRSGFKRRREATVCRSLLQKLKDEQASAVRNQQYPAASCPICFEDLAKPEPSPSSPSSSSAARVANAYKDSQSDCDHGASSSKSDAPSAPPLGAHPEYESLLDKSKTHGSADQGESKHSRCVHLVSPVLPFFAMLLRCHHSLDCVKVCESPLTSQMAFGLSFFQCITPDAQSCLSRKVPI